MLTAVSTISYFFETHPVHELWLDGLLVFRLGVLAVSCTELPGAGVMSDSYQKERILESADAQFGLGE